MAAEDLERTIEELNAAMQELVRVIAPQAAAEVERTKATRDAAAAARKAAADEAAIRLKAANESAAAQAKIDAKKEKEADAAAAKADRKREQLEAKREAAQAESLRKSKQAEQDRIDEEKATAKKRNAAFLQAGEALVGAFAESSKAIYRGELGAKSSAAALGEFSKAVQLASVGLALLIPGGPLIKAIALAAGYIAGKFVDTLKAATEQTGKTFDLFQEIGRVGGDTAGGLTGVFNGLQQLGLGIEQADVMFRNLGENSSQLAAFGGTVAEGQKALQGTVQGLRGFRTDLGLLGLDRTKIVETTTQYIRVQQMLTRGTKDQIDTSSEAVMKYVKETDLLTRITGANRKQQEDILQKAQSEEIFGSFTDELRDQGKGAAAKNLETFNLLTTTKIGPGVAQGLRDALVAPTSEAAQKFVRSAGAEGQAIIETLKNSSQEMSESELGALMNRLAASMKDTNDSMRPLRTLGGDVEKNFFANAELRNATLLLAQDQERLGKLSKEEQQKVLQDAKDARRVQDIINQDQDSQLKQQRALHLAQDASIKAMEMTSDANRVLADAALAAAEALFGLSKKQAAGPALTQARRTLESSTTKATVSADKVKDLEKAGAPKEQVEAAKKQADADAAQVAQDIRLQREAALKEANERREQRRKENIDRAMGKSPATAGSTAGPAGAPTTKGAAPAVPGAPGASEGAPAAPSGGAGPTPKLSKVTSRSGKSASVGEKYAPAFQQLVDYLDGIGYNIYSMGGYVDRDVRNQPGVKSIHGHGAAIDINPDSNPLGSKLVTDMPENIGEVARSMGLGWGGNWSSKKDAMHFSAAVSEGGSLLQASEGGVFAGPKSGYNITLHGTEAVVPLKQGNIPVELKTETMQESLKAIVDDFKSTLNSIVSNLARPDVDLTRETLEVLKNIERAAKTTSDTQDKLLRVAQN